MRVVSGTCLRAAVVALAVFVGTATSASAQAVITNGTGVALGVNAEGHLNVDPGGSTANPGGITVANSSRVGVAFEDDYGAGLQFRDATSPGCFCEGWGVAADGVAGYANVSTDGGAVNLTVASFASTASTAISTVSLTSLAGLTVTHEYKPSASPSLYEAVVTITNGTGAAIDEVLYRRVMDWDVPTTEFAEYVTIQGSLLGDNIETCNNGFWTANPTSACSPIGEPLNSNFVDSGPADHGALFTFQFDPLAVGESRTFSIFYGAAANEAAALAALGAVGAEGIYSFGQPSSGANGSPGDRTFIFGFGGVGAPPIGGAPEPATLFLLGSGLATVIARRYRRS